MKQEQTILLTGSAGFIGFHTAQKLLNQGHKIIGLDSLNNYYNPNLKIDRNKILQENKNYSFYHINLSDQDKLDEIFKKHKIDKICHLAAQAGVRYSLENPLAYEESNLKSFINILEAAKKYQIKDFIYASSSSVYGNNQMQTEGFKEDDIVDRPISLYAATKKANELIAHNYHHLNKINCTGLRFFTVYGPYGRPDMAIYIFTKRILNNQSIDVFNNGNMYRDFTYIDDITDGIIKALDKSYPYEIFNLGNNQSVKLTKLIETIEEKLNKKAIIEYKEIQPGDVERTFANIDKANKMLDFKPQTKIEEGIENFVNWYKKYHKI